MAKIGLSLTAAACVALGAQSAEAAECSENASKILDLAATATGLIPQVGPVVSAGIAVSSTLVCEEGSPLDAGAVVGLIRDEFDENAHRAMELAIPIVQGSMLTLTEELTYDYEGIDIETLDPDAADDLVSGIIALSNTIALGPEPVFFAAMTSRNNARITYDLGPAILLANFKLMLAQLATSLEQSSRTSSHVTTRASEILTQIEAYRREANRLRGMHIEMERKPTSRTAVLKRSGTGVGISRKETFSLGLSSELKQSIEDQLTRDIEDNFILPLLDQLDDQDEHLALLEARALALLEDPFRSLGDVSVTAPTGVWLKNASVDANNRCLFNRKGFVTLDDTLQNGATRMRECDRLSSHQEWHLQDNGLIRSAIADLCLTATSDNSIVKIEPCDATEERQIWTRHGDQFRVEINNTERCLTPSNGGLNNGDQAAQHKPCDADDDRQQWLVYAPLRQGKPINLSSVDPSSLVLEDIRELAERADLCLTRSFSDLDMRDCSRDNVVLWAHAADETLRSFLFLDSQRGVRPASSSDRKVGLFADPVPFSRSEADDGSVTFTNTVDGTLLFPGAVEDGADVFSDAPVTNAEGELDDIMFWRHTNGGKFAE